MTFLTGNFELLQASLAPKSPKFSIINIVFCLKHTVFVIIDTQALQTIFIPLRYGTCLPKTTLEPKLAGGLARGPSKKFGTPTYFSNLWSYSNFKVGIYTTWVWDRADNGSAGHAWVMGQMGQQIWMSHMGHGSVSVTRWPTSKSVKCEQPYQ